MRNDFEILENRRNWKVIRTSCDCTSGDHILSIEIDDSECESLNEATFYYKLLPKQIRNYGNWLSRLLSRISVAFKIIFNIEVEYDESFLFRDKANLYSLCNYIVNSIENMDNKLEQKLFYKGYIGEWEFDEEDLMYYGRVINCGLDVVDFKSSQWEDLYQSFKDSVDAYLEFSEEFKNKEYKND